jgi:hypothetical protein
MCPGQKEFVSTKIGGERIQKQKCSLLVILKELYIAFKKKNPSAKLASLSSAPCIPNWCVTVTFRGAQSVNVKLMTAALPGSPQYETLMEKMVCNTKDRNYDT